MCVPRGVLSLFLFKDEAKAIFTLHLRHKPEKWHHVQGKNKMNGVNVICTQVSVFYFICMTSTSAQKAKLPVNFLEFPSVNVLLSATMIKLLPLDFLDGSQRIL